MPNPHDWHPDDPAIWRENAPGEARAITLRHPSYPYEDTWASNATADLFAIAAGYLEKVRDEFDFPQLFDPQTRRFVAPLAWLPVDLDDSPKPFTSVWVKRFTTPAQPDELIDRTAILLAVQSWRPDDETTALGSGLGIRIIAHVSAGAQLPRKVRITGSACSSELANVLDPYPPRLENFLATFFQDPIVRSDLTDRFRVMTNRLPGDPVFVYGVRPLPKPAPSALLEVYANAPRRADRPDEPA